MASNLLTHYPLEFFLLYDKKAFDDDKCAVIMKMHPENIYETTSYHVEYIFELVHAYEHVCRPMIYGEMCFQSRPGSLLHFMTISMLSKFQFNFY
jgi:hypothetical protein